jgi:small-conductance mechanosensitive channel
MVQPGADKNHDDFKRLISIYTSREEVLLSRIKVMTAAKNGFMRLSTQYVESTKKAIAKAKLDNLKSAVKGIWGYELFATEDVYTVDGKEIKGKRGVTVAKVASALALLIFGWIVSAKSTKVLFRHAVKRYDMSEGGALLARRLLMTVIFVSLLFFSLNLMRIPLTAFAFLGGAIALGTGFGIQDLMKNLISGLMLLAERPFRIGDLIEVGGVRGRVTSIGIRSSTIRDVAGIETLVPNSTFVQMNVTNWTYSSQKVRYSISVGVAYGSDIGVVQEQLLRAAGSNPDVLKNPEPLVRLDDFGADALVFGLYYWIGLNSVVDPKVIASDLRVMVEKFFSSEGIVIAYPQRDIHIETLKPLQVEVVEPG